MGGNSKRIDSRKTHHDSLSQSGKPSYGKKGGHFKGPMSPPAPANRSGPPSGSSPKKK